MDHWALVRRVIARERSATMFTLSNIEDSPIGHTEKAINGLFNLAKMITPSIIFINKADSLSQVRISSNWI